MTANQCPACGEVALSVGQKLFLGPGRTKPCRHCDARVSVSFKATWAMMAPMLVLLAIGQFWWFPKTREVGFPTSYIVATAVGILLALGLCGYVQHRMKLIEK